MLKQNENSVLGKFASYLRDDLYSFVMSIICSFMFGFASIVFFLDGAVLISVLLVAFTALFIVISFGVYRNYRLRAVSTSDNY